MLNTDRLGREYAENARMISKFPLKLTNKVPSF